MVRAMARALLASVSLAPIATAWAQDEPQNLVETAEVTLQNVLRDHPNSASLQENLSRAHAVLIFPRVVGLSSSEAFRAVVRSWLSEETTAGRVLSSMMWIPLASGFRSDLRFRRW